MDVESLNLGEFPVGALDELRDDRDLLGGIESESGAGAVKGGVSLAVAVEVAAIGVTVACVSVRRVRAAAVVAGAGVLCAVGAGMGGEGG